MKARTRAGSPARGRTCAADDGRQPDLFAEPGQQPEPVPEPQACGGETFELVSELPLSPWSPAPRQGRHSLQMLNLARDLFSRGASYKTVAASLGASIYTARDWMHRYRNGTFETLLEPRAVRAPRFGNAVKARVLLMRAEQGLSYNELARETGISRATIRRWLSRRETAQDEDMLRRPSAAAKKAPAADGGPALELDAGAPPAGPGNSETI